MNILILEDTNTFVEEFVDILKNNNLFTDAHFFCLGDHFEKIDDTKDYQVIFIDVHLSKSINGIDFSIELKKKFPKALIVFVTMNNNFVHKSMELQPFYFIRKDHLNEDMSIFFKMFKEHLENTSFIVINAREKRVRINTSDIIYIEADGHYLKIVTLDGEYKFKEKIKEFKTQLNNNNIIQVHRSYLINLDLNFVEVFTLTTFVYLYYSFSSRKQFCLLLTSLFLICELCDILRENGFILMIGYFIISYSFVIYKKDRIFLGDAFILGGYIFFIFLCTFILYYFFRPLLNSDFSILFYILVGVFSKTILVLFTYWLLSHLKYDLNVPNQQYLIVIITEILVLSIFGIIGYASVDITVSFSSFIVCSLLLIVFFLIIINGIYFNRIYTEKMQYEKQLQKEKYIKQSLRLIQNISYDIDDKKHRIHWILEHIKHLNNDTNTKISKAIEQYQSKNTYQKLVASKNPVFDILISVKINRLQDDNISIKPFFEISQNEKYDDLDFIDIISEILNYVKRNSEITLHIKGQGIYTLVELYSENDFYDYDRCKIESDLIVKEKNIYKDGIYYMKFLLKGTDDDDVRENL